MPNIKAVGYKRALPIDDPEALLDVVLPEPTPGPHDLIVDIKAISVNPADTKMRRSMSPAPGETKVLGWDAAGVVATVGADVTLFRPGDKVWYAGSIARPGTYAERHAVDERIVGKMPATLSYAQAAALPLTSITAWELLFDRLQVLRNPLSAGNQLLVIGAAGGVGSILLQLARKLTDLTIVGTASNPGSEAWVRERGAHHVIDYRKPLVEELREVGIPSVAYVACLTQTEKHFAPIAEALTPEGRLAIIDDPAIPLDIMKLKSKSVSLHWEFMFTRSLFNTVDMIEQHKLLDQVSELVDQGIVKSTLAHHFGTITAANVRRAHAQIESGQTRGKIVLEGF